MPRKRLLKNIKTSLSGILSFVLIVGLYSFYNIGTIHAEVSDSYKKAVLGTDSLSILASEDESYAKDGSEYTDNMLHFKRGETVSYIKFDLANLDSNKTILKATVRLMPTENFDKETNKIYAFMLDESWNSKKQDVQEIIKLLGTYDGEKFNPVGAISGPLPPISGNELVNEFLNTAHGEGYIYKDGNTTLVDITDIVSEQISNGNYGVLLVTDAVDKDYTFWSSENGEKEPTLSVEYKEDSSDSDGIDNGDANDDTDNTGDEDSDNIDDSGDDDGIEEDLSGDLKPVHVVCEKGEKTFRGNDTYISGSSNDKNFSDKEELMVGANVDKPLFYWDLAEIPRNAIIDSATFTFNVKNSGDVDNVYRFMGVSKNWHDSIKDVTWIDVNSSEKWEVPGANGDNDVNGIASVLNDVNNTGKYEADLRFLTIDWTSNPEDNNGMILEAKGNGTDGSQIIYSYDSKEDLRPNFTIKYRVCAVADETTGDNAEPCDFGTIAKGWQVYPKFTDANVSYRHYEAGNGFQKIESERQGSGIYQDILLAENKYYEVRFDADIESGGVQVILKDSLSNQSKIFEPNKSDYLETTDDFVPDELYVLTTKSKTVATVKSISVNEMSDDEMATLNDDDENDDENSDGNDDGIGGNDTNNGGIEESLCGNGVIDEGELCDDGNLSNSDGCSSLCEVEKGYT